MEHTRTPTQCLALRKRTQHRSRDTSRDPSRPPHKRPRHAPLSPADQLCDECASIPWDIINQGINYQGRIDWRGRLVVRVGKRYRNISPSTKCPLCWQLHSPWIEPFLKTLDPSEWKGKGKGKYFGDSIHIFRHLRHLTHVNDFQTSMNTLRKNNAPFHIAVVPFGRKWRGGLQAHMASHGMVVVVPNEGPQSEIFIPQQVSEKFDPEVAQAWLKFCRRHENLCNPKSPMVEGMKVIDCESKDRIIQIRGPGDEYVALSYVWGSPAPSEGSSSTEAGNKTPQREVCKARVLQPIAGNSSPIPKQKLNLVPKEFLSNQTSEDSGKKPTLRLPRETSLTIEDAIRVTKNLGYRFLWVDKYCIDQSSETEKQQQCSRMGDIYAGSQVTIFALGPDAHYGLPGVSSRPRRWQQQSTIIGKFKIISTMADPHICIAESKWSTRGWTYQEGLFSTRRLFFTDYQAYFECNAMNCVETFKSNLKILHTQSFQRLRAFHRAGKFVCGNSNKFSHLNVKGNVKNHRKIDTVRQCQYHIQEYTKRELTNKNDILEAFAGIARFYAHTTAKIISLAGLPIPFPIATLCDPGREHLDHLSYALAWSHHIHKFSSHKMKNPMNQSELEYAQLPWTAHGNPEPQRRLGFPSWSWAGWFGEITLRKDLPFCWTSYLSSVRIGFKGGLQRNYSWLTKFPYYRHFLIQRLLTADELCFDAYVVNPEKLKFWKKDPHMPTQQIPSKAIRVNLSRGSCSLELFRQKLLDGELECLVLGTYGEPRKDVFQAIQDADKKAPKARKGRIGLFERQEPDSIVCLVVRTVNGTSYRRGLVKIEFKGSGGEAAVRALQSGPKRGFKLR